AILSDSVPASVSNYGLLVNPVHVLDLAFALPGLVIAALLLMKKHRLGYILTPIFLVFVIILAVALIGMAVMLKIEGISDDIALAGFFAVLAVISTVFLFVFLSHLRSHKRDDRSTLYRQADSVVGKYSADKDDISLEHDLNLEEE
ncbi:MAG: hypothetical protein ACERK6_10805, partial [Candidatus Aminicenantaceae bacterium]